METKAPSPMVKEISDNARWSWRPEVLNTCETWSISIMAVGHPPADAGFASTCGRDTFISAFLPDMVRKLPIAPHGKVKSGIPETCKAW